MRCKLMVQRSGFVLLFALVIGLIGLPLQAQDRLKIVASYSILADVVKIIAGDVADVTTLMPVGSDPHSYSPTPGDIAALAEADVVFVTGVNFEASLIESIQEAAEDTHIVEVSSCVQVIASGTEHHLEEPETDELEETEVEMAESVDPAMTELCNSHYAAMEVLHADMHHDEIDSDENDHEADEEHDHAEVLGPLYTLHCGDESHEDEAEKDEAHQHGACDPHVWTDPHNVIYWTLMIRDTLSELDPTNAQIYAANAESYADALDTLTHDFIVPMVATIPEEQRILLTNHETLGYFAAAYGFEIVGTVIPGSATLSEPSAAEVAAMIDLIRDEGVSAVFAETTVNTRLAEQVAAESGTQFYTLYSDSLSDPDGEAGTYLAYMRYNVTTIVEALGGGQ